MRFVHMLSTVFQWLAILSSRNFVNIMYIYCYNNSSMYYRRHDRGGGVRNHFERKTNFVILMQQQLAPVREPA